MCGIQNPTRFCIEPKKITVFRSGKPLVLLPPADQPALYILSGTIFILRTQPLDFRASKKRRAASAAEADQDSRGGKHPHSRLCN